MTHELSGFQKSAPTTLPMTRDQTTSAWDVDLSPFHQLVIQQGNQNKELMNNVLSRMEEMIQKLERISDIEEERQVTRKTYAIEDPSFWTSHGKQQWDNLISSLTPLTKIQDIFTSLQNYQKLYEQLENQMLNFQEKIRHQHNELTGSLHNIQEIIIPIKNANNSQEIENRWSKLQNAIEEQSKLFQQLPQYYEHLILTLHPIHNISEQIDTVIQKNKQIIAQMDTGSNKAKKIENIIFWSFMFLILVILFFTVY